MRWSLRHHVLTGNMFPLHLPPPPCSLFLLVPATPRLASIEPELNGCNGLGSDVMTSIQKGRQRNGAVSHGAIKCGAVTRSRGRGGEDCVVR